MPVEKSYFYEPPDFLETFIFPLHKSNLICFVPNAKFRPVLGNNCFVTFKLSGNECMILNFR